jgi:hypothetical protein
MGAPLTAQIRVTPRSFDHTPTTTASGALVSK